MAEVEFEGEIYNFPEDASDEEILSFFSPNKVQEKQPEKLEPGVYQDEQGSIFKVTKEGDIQEIE